MKPIVAAFIIGVISGYYVAGLSDAEIASAPHIPTDMAELQEETPNAVIQDKGDAVTSSLEDESGSVR